MLDLEGHVATPPAESNRVAFCIFEVPVVGPIEGENTVEPKPFSLVIHTFGNQRLAQ